MVFFQVCDFHKFFWGFQEGEDEEGVEGRRRRRRQRVARGRPEHKEVEIIRRNFCLAITKPLQHIVPSTTPLLSGSKVFLPKAFSNLCIFLMFCFLKKKECLHLLLSEIRSSFSFIVLMSMKYFYFALLPPFQNHVDPIFMSKSKLGWAPFFSGFRNWVLRHPWNRI